MLLPRNNDINDNDNLLAKALLVIPCYLNTENFVEVIIKSKLKFLKPFREFIGNHLLNRVDQSTLFWEA